jgi:hypothetical protein
VFEAFVLKVLISSPGDTGEEVRAVKESLHGWNGSRAEAAQAILLPRHWKSDAVPRISAEGGQSVINEQLVHDADIVIALFDSRLGQATAQDVSGTAEEIRRASEAGKHVHVWFSDEPIPRGADLDQLHKLQKFRSELEGKGLLGTYDNASDLAYKVRAAIEHDVSGMRLGAPKIAGPAVEHARPLARREGDYLVIENKSETVAARQFSFTTTGAGHVMMEQKPFWETDLLPLGQIRFGLSILYSGEMLLSMRWMERGMPQQGIQTVDV